MMPFTPEIVITCIAIMMGVLGVATIRKQASADSCPAHNRHVGSLAIIIGWAMIITSIGLVAFTWLFM